jgi:hypothetical protein
MSQSKEPPRLPDVVVDEAGPSPSWLPWLGVGLLCALALFIALRVTIDAKGGAATEASEGAAGTGAGTVAGAVAEPSTEKAKAAELRR